METQALGVAKKPQSPGTAAHYIAALSTELARLARENGLGSLGYILDMARLEAEQVAKGSENANGTADDGGAAGPKRRRVPALD